MVVMQMNPSGTEYLYELSGGRACLDFVNTVSGDRHAPAQRERLGDYAALLAWARQSGAIDASHARRLLAQARRRPGDAEAAHAEAIALREALFRLFLAVAEGREPAAQDLARLSSAAARASAHRRLERSGDGYAFGWDDPPDALEAPLWRVAASAADLLTCGEIDRVRVCGLHDTHECSWLFMDGTRARTRRWCSMKECGNKAKARRHYARARGDT